MLAFGRLTNTRPELNYLRNYENNNKKITKRGRTAHTIASLSYTLTRIHSREGGKRTMPRHVAGASLFAKIIRGRREKNKKAARRLDTARVFY